jgi:hypothetical protein
VTSVLLPPFSTDFDGIVKRFLELGEESFFKTVYRSYFRAEQPFVLVPCYLELRHYTEDGMNYKIYVCIKERDDKTDFALVDPDTGHILGVGTHLAAKLESLGVDTSGAAHFTVNSLLPEYKERRAIWATPTGGWVNTSEEELDESYTIWEPYTKLRVESIVLHGPGSTPIDRLEFTFDASSLTLDVKEPQSIRRSGKRPMAGQEPQDYEAYPESPLPFNSLQQDRLRSFTAPRPMKIDGGGLDSGRDSGEGEGKSLSNRIKFSPRMSPRVTLGLMAGKPAADVQGTDMSSLGPGFTPPTPADKDKHLSIVTKSALLKSAVRQPSSDSPMPHDSPLEAPERGVSFRARLGSFADATVYDKMSIQSLPEVSMPIVPLLDDGSVTEFGEASAPSETSTTTSSSAVDIRRLLLRAKNGLDPDLRRFLRL